MLNTAKRHGLWFGNRATTPTAYGGMAWTCTAPVYLKVILHSIRNSDPYWEASLASLKHRAACLCGRHLSIFRCTTACNVFLAIKAYFVLQMLHCARTNVHKFHGLFSTFVWCSTWELMRRDNLFRSVLAGSLGLTHLFLRPLVSRLHFIKTAWHSFFIVFLQTQLPNLLLGIILSTVTTEKPRLCRFVKNIVDSMQFFCARCSTENLFKISGKGLYSALIGTLFPLPLYHAFSTGSPGQDVLQRVRKLHVPPSTKHFLLKCTRTPCL